MERKYLFNEVAQEYDKYRPGCPEQLFLEILEDAAIKPDDSILDIGCGFFRTKQASHCLKRSKTSFINTAESCINRKPSSCFRQEKIRKRPRPVGLV